MADIAISVLASLGATGLAAYVLRHWLVERLRQSIKHEYDEKLERLRATLLAESSSNLERYKSDLSREASVLAVAHRALGESVSLAQRQRVEGLTALWKALLNVRNNAPTIFTFLDALLPDEYDTLHRHEFKTFTDDVTPESLRAMAGENAKTIEWVRPFVGEYLWFLFYVYQGIHFRITMLYWEGKQKQRIPPWFQDEGTLKLLASVATEEELGRFRKLQWGQIASMRQLIESKFLRTADRIISGQATGSVAVEEAARISKAVAEVNAQKGSNMALNPTAASTLAVPSGHRPSAAG